MAVCILNGSVVLVRDSFISRTDATPGIPVIAQDGRRLYGRRLYNPSILTDQPLPLAD
jgi:hypothetical protein